MRISLKLKPAFLTQGAPGGENYSIALNHPLKEGFTISVEVHEDDMPTIKEITTTGFLIVDEIHNVPATPANNPKTAFNILDQACDTGNPFEIGKAQIKGRCIIAKSECPKRQRKRQSINTVKARTTKVCHTCKLLIHPGDSYTKEIIQINPGSLRRIFRSRNHHINCLPKTLMKKDL